MALGERNGRLRPELDRLLRLPILVCLEGRERLVGVALRQQHEPFEVIADHLAFLIGEPRGDPVGIPYEIAILGPDSLDYLRCCLEDRTALVLRVLFPADVTRSLQPLCE